MEELVEDDICILNHEKADNTHKRDSDIPVPSYTGDESVASHFALVTAYEDIKKRLKETEKENSFLKKKVRILEEKVLGSRLEEECSSVVREQVNKAYQAYREACIDRDHLKSKLEKMAKENAESLKNLNEQLQSKEVELLQLRTEVETQQVIKSLNCTQANWELEKLNSDLKVHSLEQDLEKLKEECNSLRKELQNSKKKDQTQDENPLHGDHLQRQDIQRSVQQTYWELKREMSNLRVVTDKQAEVLRKLRRSPLGAKKAPCTAPVQCVDLNISKLNLTSGVVCKNLSQNDKALGNTVSPPLLRDAHVPSERVTLQAWTEERPIPADGKTFQEHHSYGKSSLEDNSWVFPSPPKPNENMFWEMKNNPTLLNCPADYLDQCNQNCLRKS
ncbi:5-azacytidine-induced protein 2 isoform X3 [Cinclus cinclus]|uniref:5-azacytidine-induced protein 2 isoform X3 n=1 Tax=Cinclus cinclus TaxID=127875 RepID=UPI002E1492F0